MKNEKKLLMIAILCAVGGVLLAIFKPAFWVITSRHTGSLGGLLILLALIWFCCLIYTKKTK